jgi:hypothetical protein
VLQDGYRVHPAFAHDADGNFLRLVRMAGQQWVRELQQLVRGKTNPEPLVWKDRFERRAANAGGPGGPTGPLGTSFRTPGTLQTH